MFGDIIDAEEDESLGWRRREFADTLTAEASDLERALGEAADVKASPEVVTLITTARAFIAGAAALVAAEGA